jgi:hypothetical protein
LLRVELSKGMNMMPTEGEEEIEILQVQYI